jgi:hypothetical protein
MLALRGASEQPPQVNPLGTQTSQTATLTVTTPVNPAVLISGNVQFSGNVRIQAQ